MSGKKKGRLSAWDIAKPLLEKDYLNGFATDDMAPRDVVNLRPEYRAVKMTNFRTNWLALKKRIQEHKDRAVEDQLMFQHDLTIYKLAKDRDECWHGSAAERLLKDDVRSGRHKHYHPSWLYMLRAEYQQFEYQAFRKHIIQESRSLVETPYWIYKKKKQNGHQEAKVDDQKKNQEDFFETMI
eukprot:scaffold8663_cov164-Cylindrotheca_fusiformis.AAC.2